MSTHVDEDAAPRTAVLILLLVWLSGCLAVWLPSWPADATGEVTGEGKYN